MSTHDTAPSVAATGPPAADARSSGRTAAGRFAPGNGCGVATRFQGSAPQHGVRAYELTGALPDDVRQWRDDITRGLVLDNGGLDALTAAQRVLVEAVADVATHRKLYSRFLDAEGLLTSRGRRRAAEDGHNASTDRLVRLLGLLGTGRRAKRVESLDDVAAEIVARRAGRPAEASTAPADPRLGIDDARSASAAPAGTEGGA